MEPKELGRRVRAERRKHHLRQAEVAAIAGVGNRFLSELEHGKPTLELGRTLQVLQTLGLELRIDERHWDDLEHSDGE